MNGTTSSTVYNYTAEYKMLEKHKDLLTQIVDKYALKYNTSKQSESQFRSRYWNVVGFLYTILFKDSGFIHNHIDSRVLKAVNQNYYQIFDILVEENILAINSNYMTANFIKNINAKRAAIAAAFSAIPSQIASTQIKTPAYTQSYAFTYSFINIETEAKRNREYCWVPMTFTVSTYVYQFITCGEFYLPLSNDKSQAEVIVSYERMLKDKKFCDDMPDYYREGDARNFLDKRVFSLKAFAKRNEVSIEELEQISIDEHKQKLKLVKEMGYDKLELDEQLFESLWNKVIKDSSNKYSEVNKAKILSELRMIGKSEPELIYNRIYTPFHKIPSMFRECIRFKGQKIVQAYDSKCNVIRMLVKVIEPIVEKNIKFAFYEKVCDLGYLTRKLEKNEFILGNQYVMKKHIGELFIPMDEFKSFVDFCNSDDPYMVPVIAFTCDTPKNIAHAEKYQYYDHDSYCATRDRMKKAFQQFINSRPCAYAFYDKFRYDSPIKIVNKFFFNAFPHIALYIQYGSYLGSAKQKFLWPHIEANEFKYISSQLHDCIKDYGYDSVTVHDAVYMGEDDFNNLKKSGVLVSDLFEAIINKDPNPKYPSRTCAKTCEKLFEYEYVKQEHDPSYERVMFQDPNNLYEKEDKFVRYMKSYMKTARREWIIDPTWKRSLKDKKRASAFRKIEQHLNRYLKELIAKDQANNKYHDLFFDLEKCELPNLSKVSKKYKNMQELESDLYDPNGFIATCKKNYGGVNNYEINGTTITFGSMPSPLDEQLTGYRNKKEVEWVKNKYYNEYKAKFSTLLEKRREELKRQYYDGLKVSDYESWKYSHPNEAAIRESAPIEMLSEDSLSALYGSMTKRKWDPEKDSDKINLLKQIKQINRLEKITQENTCNVEESTSLFDL